VRETLSHTSTAMGSCGRRRSGVALCLAALAASLAPTGTAFYLPGVAPYNYEAGERVEIRVNKLTSTHTQLPENYYSLPFCVPDEGVHHYGENLGLFLTGDRIENSPYRVYMQHDESCKILCQKSLTKDEALLLTKAVWNEYRHNWIVDNLPAASRTEVADYVATSHSQGFPVGFMSDGKYYLNNHLHLIIDYHPVNSQENPDARVVGFIVVPFSVQHVFKAGQTWDGVSATIPPLKTCETMLLQNPIPEDTPWQEVVAGEPILFTFDVEWHWSETEWASRWDIYLSMDNKDTKVHWFSIVDSLLIVVFLTAMIGMILLRNLHRDIMRYNRVPTEEERAEEREESGWKLVHADVFRPPARAPMLLAVSVGTGMQIVCMGFATIFFAAVGFLSPANRGSLMIAVLLLYVMFGSVAGYHSARLYKTFKGKQFQRCTILTALLYPSICFSTFFILNIVTWSYGSTQAVPFLSIITLLVRPMFVLHCPPARALPGIDLKRLALTAPCSSSGSASAYLSSSLGHTLASRRTPSSTL
jgi:transmembrane 9 superfamily protein 2/4